MFPSHASPAETRNHDNVRHITRPDATTDRQLNALQQSPFPAFALQPFHGNFGQTALHIAATAPSADRNLPDHPALRFQADNLDRLSQSLIRPRFKRHLIKNSVEIFQSESAEQPSERDDKHPHDR
jgi:hypothetical protein